MGKINIPPVDGKVAATVLVNPGSRVKAGRCHVSDTALDISFNDNAAPAFTGSHLDPVKVVAID